MKNHILTSLNASLATLALTGVTAAFASSLDQSEKVERSIVSEAKASQRVVNQSSDSAFEIQTEIDALQAEINSLEVYEKHLGKVIDSQNKERSSLDTQLNEISDTRQSVIPLMYEMLEALSDYVDADMPLRKEARLERVEKLQELMTQSDISDAEKYRRILEAYQIELDYVSRMATYEGQIEVAGVKRETEQLYVGHLSLIARSLNRENYWVWSVQEKEWVELDSNLNRELDKAFLVANKLASPSILMLPLSQQEAK